MRVDNINMLNDTMAIMDRGYYEVNGKRVNLKLSKNERKEISVFLPKDVKRISDNKDFPHVHVNGKMVLAVLTWILIPWQSKDIRIAHICSVRNQSDSCTESCKSCKSRWRCTPRIKGSGRRSLQKKFASVITGELGGVCIL